MDKKRLTFTILALAAALTFWGSTALGLGTVTTLTGALSHVGLLTGVFLALYGLADHLALRLPFAQRIGLPPRIHGTWVGSAQTNWQDPRTGVIPGPIPMMLTVKQSLTRVSCTIRTVESTSYSSCEQFDHKPSGDYELRYFYSNIPNLDVKERSPDHQGSTMLYVKQSPDLVLEGSYLTHRDTKGTLRFTLYTRKLLDSLPNGMGAHPVTEVTPSGKR